MSLTRSESHNLWHHFAMVVTSEINNLIWFLTGLVLVIGGWVVYEFTAHFFFKIAIGLPLFFSGISVVLMMVYEVFLTLLDTRRIKGMCKFCEGK